LFPPLWRFLLSTEPIGTGDPYDFEEEEYTGNAGATMEYWYHRAATIVWPKETTTAHASNSKKWP
ncbi:MAG: hypothetical protein KDN22_30990, partial [Verrucomicrobiae bacterium]|nr:hypothetical protein [Verrucomicrobiae bacterium]